MATHEDPTMKLQILSPDTTLFDGQVKEISCHNEKGQFDVLFGHANFMSMIDKKITVIQADGVKKEYPVEQALIEVHNNEIYIFVNIMMTQELAGKLKEAVNEK